jgi:hypothetical protein
MNDRRALGVAGDGALHAGMGGRTGLGKGFLAIGGDPLGIGGWGVWAHPCMGTSLNGFNLGSGGCRVSSSGGTGALHVEVILLGDESTDAWAKGDEEDDSLRGDDLRCVADWRRRRPQRGRLRHSE